VAELGGDQGGPWPPLAREKVQEMLTNILFFKLILMHDCMYASSSRSISVSASLINTHATCKSLTIFLSTYFDCLFILIMILFSWS
jgi:hypothetical protein